MATYAELERFTIQEVIEFLSQKLAMDGVVSEESLESLRQNRVAGKAFLALEEEELRELFPLIGERKAIRSIIDSYKPQQVIWKAGTTYVHIDHPVASYHTAIAVLSSDLTYLGHVWLVIWNPHYPLSSVFAL